MSDFGMPVWWHAQHTKKLKDTDKKLRELQGPNPELPKWSDTPRGGAFWTDKERVALVERMFSIIDASEPYFEKQFWVLAELGYIHGRSSLSIEAELKKVLGWTMFLKIFPR